MADDLSVSLRAWPPNDKRTESLPFLIARINEQRGSFRNITEAGLQEEILAAEASNFRVAEDEEPSGTVEDGLNVKTRRDELSTAREEIIKQVSQAYSTSSHALDLVSLLLSNHLPKAAEATVSPFIKAAVPFGSLGTEIMQESSQSEAETTSEDLVSLGWRMHSLTRSANSLLASASRLEQEIGRETTYWQEVLAVKGEGWPLCRLPRERHTLGVRFGSNESISTGPAPLDCIAHDVVAHGDFRDRDLAALRRGADGNIELDRGPRWQRDQRLRVSLLRNGVPSAASTKPTAPNEESLSLSQTLARARNSLFDEELYHELNREARNLVNHEVRCVKGSVRFPYKDGSQVQVDLVAVDEEKGTSQAAEPTTIPNTIAVALPILLSHAHRQSLWRRSQPPPPIAESPPPRPFYALLRPILEFVQHDTAIKAVNGFLGHLKRVLSAADLPFSVDETVSSLRSWDELDEPSRSQGSMVDMLVNRLLRPHHTQMTLHLPSKRTILKLDIRTSILPPTLGTSLQLSIVSSVPDSGIATMPQTVQFSALGKLRKHILYLIGLDIVSALKAIQGVPVWLEPKSPYQADLIGKNPSTGLKDQLSFSMDEGGLHANWTDRARTRSHVWVDPGSSISGEHIRGWWTSSRTRCLDTT